MHYFDFEHGLRVDPEHEYLSIGECRNRGEALIELNRLRRKAGKPEFCIDESEVEVSEDYLLEKELNGPVIERHPLRRELRRL
jgi:hypothetical protein